MMEPSERHPRYHAGKTTLAYVLFALPGGMKTISRRQSPRSTSSRWRISSRWCAAGTNPSCRYSVYAPRLVRAFFRASNSESSECGEDFGGTEVSDIPADPDVGAGLRLAG